MKTNRQLLTDARKRGKADALRCAHRDLREPIETMRNDAKLAAAAFDRARAVSDEDAARTEAERLTFAKAWADEGERIQRAIVKRIEALGERL